MSRRTLIFPTRKNVTSSILGREYQYLNNWQNVDLHSLICSLIQRWFRFLRKSQMYDFLDNEKESWQNLQIVISKCSYRLLINVKKKLEISWKTSNRNLPEDWFVPEKSLIAFFVRKRTLSRTSANFIISIIVELSQKNATLLTIRWLIKLRQEILKKRNKN